MCSPVTRKDGAAEPMEEENGCSNIVAHLIHNAIDSHGLLLDALSHVFALSQEASVDEAIISSMHDAIDRIGRTILR